MEGQTFTGPWQIGHALPDGKFSSDDAVAKEVLRAQCGPSPAELIAVTKDGEKVVVEPEATARNIACARIYGASAADVATRLRAKYPFAHKADDSEATGQDAPGFCMPLKLMVDLAAHTPAFTIEPPCAAK